MARQPASEFLDVKLVKDHLERATTDAGRRMADILIQEISSQLECNFSTFGVEPLAFDSPLEAAFWVWWLAIREIDPYFTKPTLDLQRHVTVSAGDEIFVIDFVLSHTGQPTRLGGRDVGLYVASRWPRIGIELDGHTFHEKTLEQVTYRNRRDRALQQAGWHVFHFSFDEFNTDPQRCIWEPVEFAMNAASQLRMEFQARRQDQSKTE